MRRSFGSVAPPAFSKNVIKVGAVYSTYLGIPDGQNYVTYFSSRGDGTECGGKCDDHSDVTFMGGTSMATPATAGAVAVIQQYLNEGGYHGRGDMGRE